MVDLDILIVNTTELKDDTALARLGAATIYLWNSLSGDLQTQLLEIADGMISGIQTVPDTSARLTRLIAANALKDG